MERIRIIYLRCTICGSRTPIARKTKRHTESGYTEISGVEILYYPIAWCAETLLHYQICSYVTDAILDVPVLKQRLLEIDREIIEYLLGMSNNAFTLSELEV